MSRVIRTPRAGRFLRELRLPVDVLATSDDWGVAKPDEAFFKKLTSVSGHEPSDIAYVGDRRDNDIAPAARAGLHTVLVKRGPWGFILDEDSFVEEPDVVVESLLEIPTLSRASQRGAVLSR